MKALFAFLLFLGVIIKSNCGTIPDSLRVDWSEPGVKDFPISTLYINAINSGATNDSSGNNSTIVNTIINSWNKSGHLEIYFPPGKYLFKSSLSIPSDVTIKGAGSDSTFFFFDLAGYYNLFNLNGSKATLTNNVIVNALKGSNTLLLDNVNGLSVGDWAFFEDPTGFITSDWAYDAYSQIVKIKAIQGNTVTIEKCLRIIFDATRQVTLAKINPIKNVSFECFKITRLDATVDQTSNFNLNYSLNAKLIGVESAKTNFAHVSLNYTTNTTIDGCYFHDAHAYGGGGQGYGIAMQSGSGQNLVQNNIFKHLRHSVLLQSGSNGNVIAYNYSRESYWSDFIPYNSAGDMVLHGNYAYANLFEGNICQNIVVDNSHGNNGPYNTYFRNRAELFGIFMNTGAGNKNNFVGNEVTSKKFGYGLYVITGYQFTYGNKIKGVLKPSGTNVLKDTSLYLKSKPDFLTGKYPPIGIPNTPGSGNIAAKQRYSSGNHYTDCSNLAPIRKTVPAYESVKSIISKKEIYVYPNPANNLISLDVPDKGETYVIDIYNMRGQFISSHTLTGIDDYHIKIGDIPSGIYFGSIKSIDFIGSFKFVKE